MFVREGAGVFSEGLGRLLAPLGVDAHFVELDEIDPVYFDTAYHVAPDTNPKPYVLLARAMEF